MKSSGNANKKFIGKPHQQSRTSGQTPSKTVAPGQP